MPIDLVQLFQISDHGLPMIYKYHVCITKCLLQNDASRILRPSLHPLSQASALSGILSVYFTYRQSMYLVTAMASMYLKRGRSECQSGPLRILAVLF